MKQIRWKIMLATSLIVLSALFYLLHYILFRDAHHIFIYLLGDIAFVFIEVLLVTLIIHSVLERREKKSRMDKLNMVIGAFFSQVGTKLLRNMSKCDPNVDQVYQRLSVHGQAPDEKFTAVLKCLKEHNYDIEPSLPDWNTLNTLLEHNQDFMLRLLENQNLLEHESFTDVLWAVFHLAEELKAREDLNGLLESDRNHLAGDIKRVYKQLAIQWLYYMKHLKISYPYLYSLAMRTNPFDKNASPIVHQ